MEEPGYGGGTGGKMRRKPLRRGAITPYDRPPASDRGVRDPPLETEERSWLGKFVVPASWFITNGASRLLSSVFRKRPPASPIQGFPVLGETSLPRSTQEVTGTISDDISAELPENKTNNQNVAANNPGDNAVLEFQQLIGQKSFTRAQYEHLMGILQSRINNSDTERSEVNDAKNVVVPLPATTDYSRPHKDPVPDDHTVSPVELAKEYMNSKVSNASPFHLNWQKHLLHENKQGQSNITSVKNFDVSSPKPLILSHISAEIPDNSYFTPISAQRSAMHKMPRSPYVKGEGSSKDVCEGSSKDGYVGSLSLETSGTKQAVGQGQVLKRKGSTLYNDFRSTCPIRRVRQKLGLNSSRRIIQSVLPRNVEPCASTVFKKDFQDDSSPNQRHCLDAHEETGFNRIASSVVDPALVQSTKMQNQILQRLDKSPSPKGKSPKLEDNTLDVTITDGIINSLSHNQEGDQVLHKDPSTFTSGVKPLCADNNMNLVPATATMHVNNAVDAGFSNCDAVSENQKLVFQTQKSEPKVLNPSSQLKNGDELKLSQYKGVPSSLIGTEGSTPTALTNFPSTSLFSKTSDVKLSIDSLTNYSKSFTFPSMPASFTSQPPPTPTMPGPLVQKPAMQKEHSATTLFTSGSMGVNRALFSLPIKKDNSHASILENDKRLSNHSTSYAEAIFSTIPTPSFGLTSSMVSSALASQPRDEIIGTNLEAKPSNESPLGLNSSNHDNTAIFKFGNNSSVLPAVVQFPSADCVVASTSLSNSAVGSTAASSLPPDSSRNQSAFAAKTLSDASNNLKFISSKSNKLDLLYPDNSVNSLSSVTGFGGIRATQAESPTSHNSASVSLFKSTSGNGANSSFDTVAPTVPSFGNSSATASNPFPSASGSHSTFSPTFLGTSNNKFSFSSTKVDNIASSDIYNGCKTSSSAPVPGFAETQPTRAQNGSSDVLVTQVQLTSGQRASGCSVSAAPGISSFAITSASPASNLFLHAGGSQPAVAPTTLSGASNNLFSFSSKPKDTGSSVLDKSVKTFPGVTDTEFGGIPRTQVLSGTISSSWPNQSQLSFPSSTIGMSSSGLGSSLFVTTHTNSKLLISTSSFPMGSGLSSLSTAAAATATTTFPLATSSNVFGLNSQPPTLPASSLFAPSASSESSGFAFVTPFIFNSTSNLASSFSSAASTTVSSRHPTFGLQKSAAGVSTSGDNEMSIEESMNGDNNRSAGSMFQQFGQPGSAAAPAFSAPAAQSASPFFQFASQQNPPLPSVPPQFQPSGSMELPQGGSFAMGSGGGGGDKSSRRIIKVRRDKMRKR